jgi:type I restriction enzyme S subunit
MDNTDRINDEALLLCNNRSNLEVGDVLFTGTGSIGHVATIESHPYNWNIKEGVYTLKPNQTKILPRYLMHLLQSSDLRDNYLRLAEGGTVKSVSMAKLRSLKIPLPSLSEQQRIVSILDKFDSLVNDISIGLPAEIEARRKQYEYYRDKLLTFKKKEVV